MKPSIGRTVIVHGVHSNGTPDQPAIVTRVWGSQHVEDAPVAVNLTVFPDAAQPQPFTSVMLYASREAAMSNWGGSYPVAYFPDRV